MNARMRVSESAASTVRSRGRHHDGLAGPVPVFVDVLQLIIHIFSLYRTVLHAGIFDIHGVLSINVDRKRKGCIDPFSLVLHLSYVMFCLALFFSLLFYSVLLCHFLSRVASYCTDSYCLVSAFTVLYSVLFYAMRHCDVCVTLYNAPIILFYVYFVPKPYLSVVFSYTN